MTRKRTTPYCTERKLFFGALSLLLTVFASYVYFVSASIVHVVVRKEINHETTEMSSYVSELESTYISSKRSVDIVLAREYGFTDVTEKIYIDRTPASLVLSRNDEG